MQCCIATAHVGKLQVSRKVSLFHFLPLLLPCTSTIANGWVLPALAQWAGMEPPIQMAEAKKKGLLVAA